MNYIWTNISLRRAIQLYWKEEDDLFHIILLVMFVHLKDKTSKTLSSTVQIDYRGLFSICFSFEIEISWCLSATQSTKQAHRERSRYFCPLITQNTFNRADMQSKSINRMILADPGGTARECRHKFIIKGLWVSFQANTTRMPNRQSCGAASGWDYNTGWLLSGVDCLSWLCCIPLSHFSLSFQLSMSE